MFLWRFSAVMVSKNSKFSPAARSTVISEIWILDRPAGTGRPKANFQWDFHPRNVVWIALWRLNLTLHNFEISWRDMFFCDDNLSKEHSQLTEYPQTSQIKSRFASTVVIFSVTLRYITNMIDFRPRCVSLKAGLRPGYSVHPQILCFAVIMFFRNLENFGKCFKNSQILCFANIMFFALLL